VLQFFRNNQLSTIPLVLLYFLFFYTAVWLTPLPLEVLQTQWGTLSSGLGRFLGGSSSGLQILWGSLVLAQAFFLNHLVNHYKLNKKYSFVTAAVVLLCYSFVPVELSQLPIIVGNSFLMLAIYALFACYDKKPTDGAVFNAGFWLSMAAVADWAFSGYALAMFFGLLMLRPFNIREILLWISGLIVPIFWLWLYNFINGTAVDFWENEILARYGLPKWAGGQNWVVYGAATLWALLLLWQLAKTSIIYYRTTLQEQKHISILYLMLLMAGLCLFLLPQLSISHLLLAALPMAILMSLNLQVISSNTRAELIHWFLFMSAALIQYRFLLG
jgi:hypothetical protein